MQPEQSICKVLAYFNVFNHPLKRNEIARFLDYYCPEPEIDEVLHSLTERGVIFKNEGFYLLHDNTAFIDNRKKENEKAGKQIAVAGKIAALLSGFPFVRGVLISGSLSKDIASRNADIDFFIITAGNRLWIARTFMHLLKKIAGIFGQPHLFCMNYYVDETAMEIREKNAFTAMEVVTALPMRAAEIYPHFLAANKWANGFFPLAYEEKKKMQGMRKSIFKSMIEKILNNTVGNWLDNYLMKVTVKRWKKKKEKSKVNYAGELMGMDAGKHYSKPDPAHLQQKILHRFRLKMEEIQYILDKKVYDSNRAVSAAK